jgi:hypothetical protein
MKRSLLNLLTVLSLLLCVAGAAAWARSYVAVDVVTVRSGRRQADLFCNRGSYVLRSFVHEADYGRSWAWVVDPAQVDAATAFRELAHFEWSTDRVFSTPVLYVIAPQWTVPAAFGILPAGRLVRRRRWRRWQAAGRCRSCGYDLRGSASGVCPECGRTV